MTIASDTARPAGVRSFWLGVAAYLGAKDAFDRAIADFSEDYADQNQRDYDALKKAVEDGQVEARAGL